MDNLFSKELDHFGISVLSDDQLLLTNSNKTISLEEFHSLISDRHKKIKTLQDDIISQLKETMSGSIRDNKKNLANPSISSIKYFLKEVSSVTNYDFSFQTRLKSVLNGCGFSFSVFSRKNIILCKMISRWLNYVSKKDLYVYSLVMNVISLSKNTDDYQKLARGIQGPWGNLDLPMQERVFKWDDVSEETYGRRADIQKQRRYVMGLEDQDPNDIKVGYYYRELRNEPYLFSDSDTESHYPHRNLLWQS